MRKTFTAKSFTGGGEEGRKERNFGQNQTALGLLAPRVARVSDEGIGITSNARLHWLLVIPIPSSLHRRPQAGARAAGESSIALGNILPFLLTSIPPVRFCQ